MKYQMEKGFNEFMREIALEHLQKKSPGFTDWEKKDIAYAMSNRKKALKSILETLGMQDILERDMYVEGNKKIFPIHFQCLCKVLLLQERSNKKNLLYKIKHKRLDEIKKDEIDELVAQLDKELSQWFEKLEYNPTDKNGRNKEELDNIYDELEGDMLEDETTEYIDTLSEDKNYSKEEVEYLQTKFSIRMQGNVLKRSIQDNLFYRVQFTGKILKLHLEIDKAINEKLDMKAIMEEMILLDDYNSELIGTVPMPKKYINNTDSGQTRCLSNKDRGVFLDKLSCSIKECLKCFDKDVDDFLKWTNKSN